MAKETYKICQKRPTYCDIVSRVCDRSHDDPFDFSSASDLYTCCKYVY